jgi:hypothetical protein
MGYTRADSTAFKRTLIYSNLKNSWLKMYAEIKLAFSGNGTHIGMNPLGSKA